MELEKGKKELTLDDIKINQALLVVESDYQNNVSLYMQSDECYQCPEEFVTDLYRYGHNFTKAVDTTVPTKLVFSDKNRKLCSYDYHFGEHGKYFVIIDETGKCNLEVLEKPVNIFYPLITAICIFIVLCVGWKIVETLYRKQVQKNARKNSTDLHENPSLASTSVATSSTSLEKPPPKKRLRSLDTFRGISLVIMVFVNYGGGKYWFFHHARWNGLTVADLVFPWFIWIMGVSMAISLRSLLRKSVPRLRIFKKILKRSIILFALGIILNTLGGHNDVFKLRIPGVLQRFGISYFVTCSVHLLFAKPQDTAQTERWASFRDIILYWPEWIFMLLLLLLHICLTFLLEVPDCGKGYLGPGGLDRNASYFNCTGGAAGYIDRVVLGDQHLYQRATPRVLYKGTLAYDPEGILGCITSIFLVYLGLQAGKVLLTYSEWKPRIVRWVIWGTVCGVIATILCKGSKEDGWIPINKNLWSVSYILLMACFAFYTLSLCYYFCDVLSIWAGSPFFFPGMNSILVYVGHSFVHGVFPWFWKGPETHWNYLFMNIWGTGLWVVTSYLLYRKEFFLAI